LLIPALWVREALGVNPAAWQETFLRAPRGASILALTASLVNRRRLHGGDLMLAQGLPHNVQPR